MSGVGRTKRQGPELGKFRGQINDLISSLSFLLISFHLLASPRFARVTEHDQIPGYTEHSPNTTLTFRLSLTCTLNPDAPHNASDPHERFLHSSVYSKDLVYVPAPTAPLGKVYGPVHPDILLAKMRPGQQLEMEMHAVKGVGKDHAKFSPVATASYRLLPEITILEPITGDDADEFVRCFPPGVADVFVNEDGEREARVINPRKDTVSREVLRHPNLKDKVRLGRIRDHFICG